MSSNRRTVLKYLCSGGAAMAAFGSGLLALPAWAVPDASHWPKAAFSKKKMDEAIQALYGQKPIETDKIKLDVPTIAQNGAVVPVTVDVDSALADVRSISLLVPGNPFALAASFEIPEGTLPFVSNRLKMRQTSDLVALVMAGGKLYSTTKNVKVTVGGCGG